MVLVGENGSGKTLVLAAVADALHEFAAEAFRDTLPPLGLGHSYFKVTGGATTRSGAPYSFSVLEFSSEQTALLYLEKTGNLTIEQLREKLGKELSPPGAWSHSENLKSITSNAKLY